MASISVKTQFMVFGQNLTSVKHNIRQIEHFKGSRMAQTSALYIGHSAFGGLHQTQGVCAYLLQ